MWQWRAYTLIYNRNIAIRHPFGFHILYLFCCSESRHGMHHSWRWTLARLVEQAGDTMHTEIAFCVYNLWGRKTWKPKQNMTTTEAQLQPTSFILNPANRNLHLEWCDRQTTPPCRMTNIANILNRRGVSKDGVMVKSSYQDRKPEQNTAFRFSVYLLGETENVSFFFEFHL